MPVVCFMDGRSSANEILDERSLEPNRLQPESWHFQFQALFVLFNEMLIQAGEASQQLSWWSCANVRSWRVSDSYKTALITCFSSRKTLLSLKSLFSPSCQLLECIILWIQPVSLLFVCQLLEPRVIISVWQLLRGIAEHANSQFFFPPVWVISSLGDTLSCVSPRSLISAAGFCIFILYKMLSAHISMPFPFVFSAHFCSNQAVYLLAALPSILIVKV